MLEEQERGTPLTLERIKEAVCDLYGNWEAIPKNSRDLIEETFAQGQLEERYKQYRSIEKSTQESLLYFNKNYPGVININNVDEIINNLKKRKED